MGAHLRPSGLPASLVDVLRLRSGATARDAPSTQAPLNAESLALGPTLGAPTRVNSSAKDDSCST